jgi:hypothetical protein
MGGLGSLAPRMLPEARRRGVGAALPRGAHGASRRPRLLGGERPDLSTAVYTELEAEALAA